MIKVLVVMYVDLISGIHGVHNVYNPHLFTKENLEREIEQHSDKDFPNKFFYIVESNMIDY